MIVLCEHCKKEFKARLADRKRGWARFCSKSCKAKSQEKRTGQYADFVRRSHESELPYCRGDLTFEEGIKT